MPELAAPVFAPAPTIAPARFTGIRRATAVEVPSPIPSTSVPPTVPFRHRPFRHHPSATASPPACRGALHRSLAKAGAGSQRAGACCQSQVEMAQAGVVGAAAYPNPTVSVIGGPQHPRIPAANPATNTRQVTVTQTIENPFVRSARIGSAEAGVEASRASFHQVRADLAAQLRVRAYELLLRQEIARMEASVFDLMEEVRRRIQVGVGVGETARFELIRADAEVLNAASRKEAALLNAQRARVALMQFTAGALKPDFAISASLFDPVNLPPLEQLRQEVPAVNPDVLRLQAESEQARLRIDQARASVLPSVDIVYSNYQDAQYTDNRGGLNVTIPAVISAARGNQRCCRRFRTRAGNAGISPLRDRPVTRIRLARPADRAAQGGDVRGRYHQGGRECTANCPGSLPVRRASSDRSARYPACITGNISGLIAGTL